MSRELRFRCANALREAGVVAAPLTEETASVQ